VHNPTFDTFFFQNLPIFRRRAAFICVNPFISIPKKT